jgi:GT2 family glycosyltransferase
MENRPDLSVIVVTHNGCEMALTTLRSARANLGDISAEWLVADSGSTDGTPEAIERAFPDVTVFRAANRGFAAGNNVALPHARGRYVLLLNPDVEIDEGTLADVVRRMQELDDEYERYTQERSVDWLVGAFLIARREAVADVGPMDEGFFLYSEEIDWCHRFRQHGWDIRHFPFAAVIHHGGDSERPELVAQLSSSRLRFAYKHFALPKAVGIHAALMLKHVLRLVAIVPAAALMPRLRRRARAEASGLVVLCGGAPPYGGS